jgi:hypothetical protein
MNEQVIRLSSSLDLQIPVLPFDQAKFAGPRWQQWEKWSVVPEDTDVASNELTEIDFSKVEFATGLLPGEDQITGEEKLKRLKASKKTRYGLSVATGLWVDYQVRKENSVLQQISAQTEIKVIDFFGDVLLSSSGYSHVRQILCLSNDITGWHWVTMYLMLGTGSGGWSPVSSQA